MESLRFIKRDDFLKLLDRLSSGYQVIVPYYKGDFFYKNFDGNFDYNRYRTVTPLRQFFFPSYQVVSYYFKNEPLDKKPFCIVGAKNCDLFSLKIHDYVFMEGDYIDQDYRFFRENNLIISSDCTSYKPVCFCLHLGLAIYPAEGFDLNLTPLDLEDGYIVEIGSEKGKGIVEENSSLFHEVDDRLLDIRRKMREENTRALSNHLYYLDLPPKENLYKLIKKGYESSVWEEEGYSCVECGACIMNCPTCHCFLLFDEEDNADRFIRARTWDGCQYKNFSQVAGGANPLRFRTQRLRNRYIKKFEFFYENLGFYACTGCGRCIENCIGKIDLQKIFKKLAKQIKVDYEIF